PDEPSWTPEDTIDLVGILADHGVNLVDVLSGGTDYRQKIGVLDSAYQAHLAEAAKKAVGDRILVATVGGITDGAIAEDFLRKGETAYVV
ncbi:uncharacterized protein BXZ73DRAFT_18721, partial [Epithele typhae]|uniref:uncharacterized protein n=1 Tax=Epithele typhae TaxID=378194 RepID=UPI002008B79E